MSNIRKVRRDINLTIDRFLRQAGLLCIARATSLSGRYVVILAEHLVEGFPCYDVVVVRGVDMWFNAFHHKPQSVEDETKPVTFDEAKLNAKAQCQIKYEEIKHALQTKGEGEFKDEPSGLEIIAPDGTVSDFNIN